MIFERQKQIIDYLKLKHFSTVSELSRVVFSSESSVRRDLKQLEALGYVVNVYGGVVLSEFKNSVVPLNVRDSENSKTKNIVAQKAAKLIFDGATVFMDGSSTVRRILSFVDDKMHLRVITNNLRIFTDYSNPNFELLCTGGTFDAQNKIFYGKSVEDYIGNFTADLFFFSSQGLSEDGEISDASQRETEVRHAMLKRANKSIFLYDSSKLSKRYTFRLCSLDDIDISIDEN